MNTESKPSASTQDSLGIKTSHSPQRRSLKRLLIDTLINSWLTLLLKMSIKRRVKDINDRSQMEAQRHANLKNLLLLLSKRRFLLSTLPMCPSQSKQSLRSLRFNLRKILKFWKVCPLIKSFTQSSQWGNISQPLRRLVEKTMKIHNSLHISMSAVYSASKRIKRF